ncbi:Domain amino terminal to FKBP-type peptidyl-prolyl isomerase, partial [Candidatus Regiella insecticola 5.15]
MKSRFKFTLLAMTITLTLNTSQTFAIAEIADKSVTTKTDNNFKTEGEKTSYALGASLGSYMENSFQEQEKLGIKLDKER